MDFKKIWLKIFDKNKYSFYKEEKIKIESKNLYINKIKKKLDQFTLALKDKNEISFLHSGHLGDIINSLPLIKEISLIPHFL